MLDNVKFKKEPVVWVTALILALQAVQAYLSKTADLGTAINAVLTALGGLIVRQTVWAPENVEVHDDEYPLPDDEAEPTEADEDGLLEEEYGAAYSDGVFGGQGQREWPE